MLKVYSPQSKMEEQHLDNKGLSQGLLSVSSHGGRDHMAREERWKNARGGRVYTLSDKLTSVVRAIYSASQSTYYIY